jgi:hypothetical protein
MQEINSNEILVSFVANKNIEMIWNIITQNGTFQESIQINNNKSKLRTYYISKTKEFVEDNLKTNASLIELNKDFIVSFIRGFQSTNNLPQNADPFIKGQKLDLSNKTPLENNVITIEEIKSERLNQFESQYDKMKNDFEQYRVSTQPSDVKFSDEQNTEPLKGQDMEDIISQTLQNRTEQENNIGSRNISETQKAREWLNLNINKPSETNNIENLQITKPIQKSVSFSNLVDTQYTQKSYDVEVIEQVHQRMERLEMKLEEIMNLFNSLKV